MACKFITSLSILLFLCCFLFANERVINLEGLEGSGTKILNNYEGTPDNRGVMDEYKLILPEFNRGVYYKSGWWPAGGNRVYPHILGNFTSEEGGIFFILELKSGEYFAFLPLCGENAYSWLNASADNIFLKTGTHGKVSITGDLPFYAWAKTPNPYEAAYNAWKAATESVQIKGWMKMREDKIYPEIFKYLGWCSWEQYRTKITENNMVNAFKNIEKSGIPVRYFLMDDGHFDRTSLKPDKEKFPNGYKPLTKLRKPDKIKWIGIWYAFLGNNHGVVAPGNLGEISKYMYSVNADKLLPKNTEKAAREFYEYLFSFAKEDGIDFLKMDFQTDALSFYAGTTHKAALRQLSNDNSVACDNPLSSAINLSRQFQIVAEEKFDALMNCNWHNAACIFNIGNSVMGRCSEDYRLGNLERAKAHLYHSYSSTPWLGQIAWGDHDMFHSNDEVAGRMMAVSKAFSGAAVYLSDDPEHFEKDNISPLCYQDGLLLRPLAPAAPLLDDLFKEMDHKSLYKVAAPLPNQTAAIVVYNFNPGQEEENNIILSAKITEKDYCFTPSMIQPFPGEWELPEDGLLVYEWYTGKAKKMNGTYEVTIKGFGDCILQVSPIRKGWSVIGRTDKYLSASSAEIISCENDTLQIKLHEAGPFGIWSEKGKPKAAGINFVKKENHLYIADLAVDKKAITITITR